MYKKSNNFLTLSGIKFPKNEKENNCYNGAFIADQL
jgi:hypothetical protein